MSIKLLLVTIGTEEWCQSIPVFWTNQEKILSFLKNELFMHSDFLTIISAIDNIDSHYLTNDIVSDYSENEIESGCSATDGESDHLINDIFEYKKKYDIKCLNFGKSKEKKRLSKFLKKKVNDMNFEEICEYLDIYILDRNARPYWMHIDEKNINDFVFAY